VGGTHEIKPGMHGNMRGGRQDHTQTAAAVAVVYQLSRPL